MEQIRTPRLLLRPPVFEDAARLSELSSDFDISRMTSRMPFPNPPDSVRQWMASLSGGEELAHVALLNNAPIGVCSHLFRQGPGVSEIGYWVGKPYWGRGFATEMLRALIRSGFEIHGLDRITIRHFTDNPASARVIAKCGFVATHRITGQSLARGTATESQNYKLSGDQARAQSWYAAAWYAAE